MSWIVEYDAKTLNVGATYALWADHFNLMVEFQEGKYLSAGLVYKVNLLGNNRWKAKLFDSFWYEKAVTFEVAAFLFLYVSIFLFF